MTDAALSGAKGGQTPSLEAPHPEAPRSALSRFLEDRPILRLLLWRLPYLAMLLLALVGVAWTSFAPRYTSLYWQLLAPVFGVICVASEWKSADAATRWRLIWTQTLHWGAIVIATRMLFLTNVQRMLNSDATALMVLGILALGTVLAGIHATAWEVAAVGVILALSIPAAALLEQMTLLLLIVLLLVIAGSGLFFWLRGRLRAGHEPDATAASGNVPPV